VSRDELPERAKQKIDADKHLISLLWPIRGIHSFIYIPKGTTSNMVFSCHQVRPSLIAHLTSHGDRKILEHFVIQLDKAHPHNSKQSQECFEATKTQWLPQVASSSLCLPKQN
jgi:hypothetical protein